MEFVRDQKVDVVHYHTFYGIPSSVTTHLRNLGISQVYTSHDYQPVCPMINLIKYDQSICVDYQDGAGCARCCAAAPSSATVALRASAIGKGLQSIAPIKAAVKRVLAKHRNKVVSGDPAPVSDAKNYRLRREASLRALNENVDLVLFNSGITKRYFEQHGFSGRAIVEPVAHQGIPPLDAATVFPSAVRKPLQLGYIGGSHPQKGHPEMLQALARLSEQRDDWRLLICGPGANTVNVPSSLRRLVDVRGVLPAKTLFERFDVLLVPSYWPEPYGFVVPEALAKGKYVVASQMVGAAWEIQSDLLHAYRDMNHMIALLDMLLEQLPERKTSASIEGVSGFARHVDKVTKTYWETRQIRTVQ